MFKNNLPNAKTFTFTKYESRQPQLNKNDKQTNFPLLLSDFKIVSLCLQIDTICFDVIHFFLFHEDNLSLVIKTSVVRNVVQFS